MRRNNTTGKGREFLNVMGMWHGMKVNKDSVRTANVSPTDRGLETSEMD